MSAVEDRHIHTGLNAIPTVFTHFVPGYQRAGFLNAGRLLGSQVEEDELSRIPAFAGTGVLAVYVLEPSPLDGKGGFGSDSSGLP